MMKKRFLKIVVVATVLSGLLFSAICSTAFAQNTSEFIQEFVSEITVNQDSTVNVLEKIFYDFGENQKRGIVRSIPVKYADSNVDISLDVKSVTDENNSPYKFETSYSGSYRDIKIGDANFTITGQHWYYIDYKLSNVVTSFKDHDELYWNITGNLWEVPIKKAYAYVDVPLGGTIEGKKAICYSGAFGSTETNCGSQIISDTKFTFWTPGEVLAGDGLTLVAGFEKGLVTFPSQFWINFWKTYLPIIIFAFFTILVFLLWFFKGKDPVGRGTIMPFYTSPRNLSPGEVGVLIDEKADLRDITASIINLAVKGYLKIKKTEKGEFSFLKVKAVRSENDLFEFEKKIYYAIFQGSAQEVLLDDLRNKFYKTLPDIKDSLYQKVVEKGFFEKNPDKIRTKYISLGITAFFIFMFLAGGLNVMPNSLYIFLLPLVGLEFLILSLVMTKKTKDGALALEEIKGYKMFLKTAEADRLKVLFSPKEYSGVFEKSLPYAIAFGVEKQWATQFAALGIEAPSWFIGPHGYTFIYFSNDLGRLNSAAASTFISTPHGRSSGWTGGSGFGGGFSGGGFGGGGGHSW